MICLIFVITGIIVLITGISIFKGNINLINSYHIQRIKEEDKKIFVKVMGFGTIICAFSIILFGILFFLSLYFKESIFMTVGLILIISGLFIGIGSMIYATSKYNKGIF